MFILIKCSNNIPERGGYRMSWLCLVYVLTRPSISFLFWTASLLPALTSFCVRTKKTAYQKISFQKNHIFKLRIEAYTSNLGLLTDWLTHWLTHSLNHLSACALKPWKKNMENHTLANRLQGFRQQVTWPCSLEANNLDMSIEVKHHQPFYSAITVRTWWETPTRWGKTELHKISSRG